MEAWTGDPKPIMVRSHRMRSTGPRAVPAHMDEWYVHIGGGAGSLGQVCGQADQPKGHVGNEGHVTSYGQTSGTIM